MLASYRAALHALGHPVTPREEAKFVIGPPMLEAWAALLAPLGDDRVVEAVRLYRAHYAAEGRRLNTVFAGIPEALDRLHAAGLRLLVATAKPGDVGQVIARQLGLMRWMTAVYGSVPGGALDRKSDLFAHILRTEPLDPAQTTVVGDWRYDMSGARANGLRALGAGWGYDTAEALLAAGAEAIIGSPDELADAVLGRLRDVPPSA